MLDEGDFLVYDPAQPLWLTFDKPTEVIVLRLPLATVEERLPQLKPMAGMKMSGGKRPWRDLLQLRAQCLDAASGRGR